MALVVTLEEVARGGRLRAKGGLPQVTTREDTGPQPYSRKMTNSANNLNHIPRASFPEPAARIPILPTP